ncbi:hypothetical protein DFH28DRAFT_1105572 [Melampsora americana]|nr:hypothetical protein DFH28DRAFT_1105572 [Melampsora americana]
MNPWREGSSPTISSVFGKDPPPHTSGSFDAISIDVPPPVQHRNLTSQSPVTRLANGLNNLGLRTDENFAGQHRGFQQQPYQQIPQFAPHAHYFHAPMNVPPPPLNFVPPFVPPFNPAQNNFASRPPPSSSITRAVYASTTKSIIWSISSDTYGYESTTF